jgi:hypothetical protein
MPKILAETTGEFELVDFTYGGAIVAHDRPSVVESTTFIQSRASLGQIRVLDTLTDEATDAEFEKYFKESDGDAELAISSFKASYSASNQTTTTKQPDAPKVKQPRGS